MLFSVGYGGLIRNCHRPTSPSRIFVGHTYAADHYLPGEGEVIIVRLSQALSGPGSTLGSAHDLPSHANRHNL